MHHIGKNSKFSNNDFSLYNFCIEMDCVENMFNKKVWPPDVTTRRPRFLCLVSGGGGGRWQEWVPCLMSRGRSWALFYRPQRSCGKVMFLHLSVILSTGGGCLPQCMLGYTPWADTPISPGQTPPAAGTHPTEMHSCVTRVLVRQLLSNLTRNHLLHSGKCWLCYL